MYISELDRENLTDEQMDNLLYSGIKDDGKSGDCIFVPGSSKAVQIRLPKAVQCYEKGRAKKILFSGGVTWEGFDSPEAVLMKDEAIKLGVPEEDILLEDKALHTKENVLASLLVLDRAFYLHHIKRLIVVTTSPHMRRFHMTLKTYMPNWIDYSLCPANDLKTRKDNWFLSDVGRRRVENEAKKIIDYVKEGVLLDEKVERG
ncbi:YdcF family protein [Tenuibacillus multivorans]|uniref:DUF218 domain-containing protein n=1 Tax=Tenuibacillus multivorans TaxID=237069 RepID=A0A1H0AYT5_9BACI|nr:YdcF family protein [Tenuibacillus multivorans]GEL77607.1 hypothetical protein TMU01_18420 [Tenuibacillus multivorans]SDN38602.1 DUF218 domain-containing protein [Tenuibacillus multivorans]